MYYICLKDKAQAEHVCTVKSFAACDIDKIILKQLGRLIKNPVLPGYRKTGKGQLLGSSYS